MSEQEPPQPITAPVSDLDAGVLAAFRREPAVLPGWTCQPTPGTPHSYHVVAGGADLPGQTFGVIADVEEGLIEVVALLGAIRPGVAEAEVLRRVNGLHQAITLGRFTLIDEPARLLFEAELALGGGADRSALVERLLPVLLGTMATAIVEELPGLAPFLVREA